MIVFYIKSGSTDNYSEIASSPTLNTLVRWLQEQQIKHAAVTIVTNKLGRDCPQRREKNSSHTALNMLSPKSLNMAF